MSKMDQETLIGSNKLFRVCGKNQFSLLVLGNEPFRPSKIFCPETNRYVYNVSNVPYREVLLIENEKGRKIFLPENVLNDDSFSWL